MSDGWRTILSNMKFAFTRKRKQICIEGLFEDGRIL